MVGTAHFPPKFNLTKKTWSGQGHHPDQESAHSTPSGQTRPLLCVNDPWTKNGFYISKWLKKKKKIFMPCNLYEIRISVSMNKVLLGYSHAHHLHIDYGCFQDTRAESDTCSAEQTAHKAENISCLALTENVCLMTPDQDFLSQPPLRRAGRGGTC